MAQQVPNPPDGWSTEADDMEIDYYWGNEGQGTMTATGLGLTNQGQPVPQMILSRKAGGDAYVFTIGAKCYMWKMTSDEMLEFVKPTTIEKIVEEMKKPQGTGEIELKPV